MGNLKKQLKRLGTNCCFVFCLIEKQ